MTLITTKSLAEEVSDFRPDTNKLSQEVLLGLQKPHKELPCKLFYDERGSRLFDKICELEEYYPTRTETAIMDKYIEEMKAVIGPSAMLIEYGSGSSEKTKIILDHMPDLAAYIPIDISKEHLINSANKINNRYPNLDVIPVCADYTKPFSLPDYDKPYTNKVVYFPGSTIGNFAQNEGINFLKQVATVCGSHGSLLIGVDLKKDPAILNRAYNDVSGVTAAFNLNMLDRLNRELNTNFDVGQFRHHAYYNEVKGRIEMHLISCQDQTVHLNGVPITFKAEESIITEFSHKYTLSEFADLAAQANFEVKKVWVDKDNLFSVQYLSQMD